MRSLKSRGATPRRDPAPSRWSYRMQRLWLTPRFRLALRAGVPFVACAGFALWLIGDPVRQTQIRESVAELRRSVAERPEFMVKLMAIDGASEELSEDIREVLPIDFPVSSFDLDLAQMKSVVEGLDAVASVDLRIRPGGILQLEIAERLPVIVWRLDGALELLDEGGRRVASLDSRATRSDLPLIVGEGADRAVPEALQIARAARPLDYRLRGLVRVGARRWDVVLDRGQRIQLPEQRPVEALEQVLALDEARELLDRAVAVVDMRNPRRPTLRLEPQAVEALVALKQRELGNDLQ